jgi:hypothetical protein
MSQSQIPFSKNVSIKPCPGHSWCVCKSGAVLIAGLSFDAALAHVKALGAKPIGTTTRAAQALGIK